MFIFSILYGIRIKFRKSSTISEASINSCLLIFLETRCNFTLYFSDLCLYLFNLCVFILMLSVILIDVVLSLPIIIVDKNSASLDISFNISRNINLKYEIVDDNEGILTRVIFFNIRRI